MGYSEEELNHLVFLSEVVLDGRKRELMAETMQCLLFLVKSLREVDLPEDVADEIRRLVGGIEDKLRSENDRMHEVYVNLFQTKDRKPFG